MSRPPLSIEAVLDFKDLYDERIELPGGGHARRKWFSSKFVFDGRTQTLTSQTKETWKVLAVQDVGVRSSVFGRANRFNVQLQHPAGVLWADFAAGSAETKCEWVEAIGRAEGISKHERIPATVAREKPVEPGNNAVPWCGQAETGPDSDSDSDSDGADVYGNPGLGWESDEAKLDEARITDSHHGFREHPHPVEHAAKHTVKRASPQNVAHAICHRSSSTYDCAARMTVTEL
jgi:hypothetical protein